MSYVDAFRPSDGRGKAATLCIGITVFFSFLLSVASLVILQLVDIKAATAGGTMPPTAIVALLTIGVLGLAHFIAFVCAAVFFLRWQHRAHRNLYALGQTPQYTPGWGVGYWFIPFINLVRPYRELRDVALLSDPQRRGFAAIGAYWACWLISGILANISMRLPDEPEARKIGIAMDLIALALEIAAAVLVYKLIRFVVDAQAKLSASSATVVSPG